MSHIYLYLAFWMCLLILSSSYLRFIIFVLGCIFAIKTYSRKIIIYCFLIGIYCVLLNYTPSFSNSKIWQVEDIKSNYVLVSNKNEKCILYNLEGVNLMDVVEIEGTFEDVYSTKNMNTFQFETYLKRKQIYKSMYVTSYKTIKQSNHPRAMMYRFIKTKEEKLQSALHSLFYKINEEEQTNIVFASGMHLYFLSALLASLLKCNKNKSNLFISFLYFIFFPVSTSCICMFFNALVKLFFSSWNEHDRCGLSMILLLLYSSSMIYEISFQLIFLFRLVNLFDCIHLNSKLKSFIILFPFQLVHFHECNILELLFFSWMRKLEGITFLCGILCLPFSFLSSFLYFFMNCCFFLKQIFEEAFSVIGMPSYIWIFIWIYISICLLSQKKKKVLLWFIVLFIVQLNCKNLQIFGEVTFLDVGQGDAILIREPFNGEVIMIDVAGKVNDTLVEKKILPYLKMRGIKTIDKVILTHDDYDHSGGLEELKELIEVKEVIREKVYEVCMKNICLYNANMDEYEDENDNSLVFYGRIGTLDYLFMGDASVNVEKEIIHKYNKLEVDILNPLKAI